MTRQDKCDSREEHTENDDAALPPPTADRLGQIRALNDRLRIHGRGGIVVVTPGIAGLDPSMINRVFAAISSFDSFDADNDPWGEHDCALITVEGIKALWKIDYFDRSRRFHSPDPANPKVTVRVLTVMRADEY